MSKTRHPMVVASAAGTIAGIVFLIADVGFVLSITDAQGAIGLFLAPFFAVWVGVCVGLIVLGCLSFGRPTPDGVPLAVIGTLGFCFGFAGLFLIASFLFSEIYQLTHPIYVKRDSK